VVLAEVVLAEAIVEVMIDPLTMIIIMIETVAEVVA